MSKYLERQIKQRKGRIVRLETNDNSLIKAKLHKYTISIDKIEDLRIKDGLFEKAVDYTYYTSISYDTLVNGMVRERYSDSEEFAILRKSVNNPSNAEFTSYYAYVEECKTLAKEWIENREKTLTK